MIGFGLGLVKNEKQKITEKAIKVFSIKHTTMSSTTTTSSVPASVPAASVPAASVPAASVPAASVPAASVLKKPSSLMEKIARMFSFNPYNGYDETNVFSCNVQ